MAPSVKLSTRMHRLLIAAGIVIPALLFIAAAWQSRVQIRQEGEATLLSAVSALGDSLHAHLQAEEMALDTAANHLRGLDRSAVSGPETRAFLRDLAGSADTITNLSVTDADGHVLATSRDHIDGGPIAQHEFFRIDRGHNRVVSVAYSVRQGQPVSLALIHRLQTPEFGFAGTIQADLDPAYLSRLFAEATPGAHGGVLVDGDGDVLAAASAAPAGSRLGGDDPLMQRIAAQPLAGLFSGRSTLGDGGQSVMSYERIPGYPVWVGIVVNEAVLTARWLSGLAVYGAAAAAGSLALVIASVLAMRRARAERDALAALAGETERRLQTERRATSAHRLEIVGQLAAGVAHEFNNLLMAVMGNLNLIARASGGNDKVQALAGAALEAAERGAKLTSSLLAFARRQFVQPQLLDANRLIEEILPLIKQSIGGAISLELRMQPDLPPCRADAAQLQTALLNLAINAKDAMTAGGRLTIATRVAELSKDEISDNPETEPGSFVAVSLSDTGSGMDPDVAAKAFDPFFTTKDIGQGIGLGLSEVLGVVRQLRGHVTLNSVPGQGSVVTLFLPRAR